MSSSRFAKREREKAKRERADRKRARREDRREAAAEESAAAPAGDQSQLLSALEALHRAYENEELSLEDFEEQRTALLEQLQI